MVTNPSLQDYILYQDAKVVKFSDGPKYESFRAPSTKPRVNPELLEVQKTRLDVLFQQFQPLFEDRKDYGNITYMPHRISLIKGSQPFTS